ncbi:hypothetical protein V6N12_063069 [Hibiscus sabdariffa]|uniref:Uncharacterized protein n=1 Tax=Hibiscus sabdariffa TaxID=183260 RepID=A0ABR2FAX1_9ROSI
MESNVAEERVESNSPKAEEESKNEQTVISGDEGNFESCKNPIIVVVDHCAERYIHEFNEVELCSLGMGKSRSLITKVQCFGLHGKQTENGGVSSRLFFEHLVLYWTLIPTILKYNMNNDINRAQHSRGSKGSPSRES